MKLLFSTLLIAVTPFISSAQISLSGNIKDKETGKPIAGASVYLENSFYGSASGDDGKFVIRKIKSGNYILKVRLLGYKEYAESLNIKADTSVIYQLESNPIMQNEVVITATRADEKSAMAVSTISKKELEQNNTARDLPYLLESVPSLVTTSDAGTGTGYTGVRIRGSDATRINVTVDGIPINDSESQIVYWVDLPDLVSSVENIQVQRGAGTSTNGAGAFGGSINILSANPGILPNAATTNSYGSFNTHKHNVQFGTGLINGHWNFDGRLSSINSDGYVDRAASDLKSYFLSGGYSGKNNFFKINILSGKEITYQSWYGIPQASLDTNRTFNFYNYENQVDDYQQDHYQAFYSHNFNSNLTLNTAFHFTHGEGYYEEFNKDELLSDYNLENVIIGNDTITTSDIIRRKWLDNDFYGTTFSLNYTPNTSHSFILGGAWNRYDGDHFGEVTWARFASNGDIRHRYYENNGLKTDFNIFGKATVDINKLISLFGDLQFRSIDYNFTGADNNNSALPQTHKLNFWNPKAGITFNFKPGQYGYCSFSVANKEPSRDDYTESTPQGGPGPERLYDGEAGYRYRDTKLSAGINYFLMTYKNQLVLTGEINDVGNYTRTNIKNSYRQGIEADVNYKPFNKWNLKGNISVSKNKIAEFREFIDDYDNGGQKLIVHKNTDLAFSPRLTAFMAISFIPINNFEIELVNKYVSKQFLDNTENSNRILNSYTTTDLRIHFKFKTPLFKEATLSLFANNIFNYKYESNGYTFSYISGGEKITENYFYPQAGINYMTQLKIAF